MASMGKEFCEKNTVKHSSGIAHRSMRNIKSLRVGGGGAGGRDWNREKILWRVLFIFYHSYLRSTYRDKRTLTLTRCKFMQTIVDDVVEEALVMALRLARYVYVPVIPVGQPDLPFGLSAQSVDDLIDGSSGATNAVQSYNSTDGTSNTWQLFDYSSFYSLCERVKLINIVIVLFSARINPVLRIFQEGEKVADVSPDERIQQLRQWKRQSVIFRVLLLTSPGLSRPVVSPYYRADESQRQR